MFVTMLKKSKGSLFSFIGILYFLYFFGQPEKTSSRLCYLLIGIFALASFIINQALVFRIQDTGKETDLKYKSRILLLFSALFGLITVLANYEHYMNYRINTKMLIIPLLFLSACCVFVNIFLICDHVFNKYDIAGEAQPKHPLVWFFGCFVLLSAFYLTIFFLCSYPGQICSDSLNQIHQIMKGNYSNHHPVYHTWIIGAFYKLGMRLFDDINAAVATYTVFQIIFMSATFSFTVTTIVEAGSKKFFATGWFLWFLLMPFHIIFSFTLWKDSMY